MRYLGVDYGDVRTGVAVSDETNFLACGLGYIKETYSPKLADKIKEYVNQYAITKIILGNPVNMNGSYGPRSEKATAFGALLSEVCCVEVVMYDERLTTVSAHMYLSDCNVRGKKRKEAVDKLSAQIILQNYLDSIRR